MCGSLRADKAAPAPRPQLRGVGLDSPDGSPLRSVVPVPLHQSLRILDLGMNPALTWQDGVHTIFCSGTGSSACYRRLVEL